MSQPDRSESRDVFASMRRRPKMFLPEVTLAAASAYVMGYWHEGTNLDEFQRWLGPQYGGRSELAFWEHIAREIKETDASTPISSLNTAEQERSVKRLLDLLDAFLTS